MTTQAHDLDALRSSTVAPADSGTPLPRRRQPVVVVLVVVVVLIGGFVALTWERWIPIPALRVARVATLPAAADAEAGASGSGVVRFQAAGWIEADPLPVQASALVSGVVAEVLVLEGERVTAGQVLARLDDQDFRLALERARAALAVAEARSAEAGLGLAVATAEQAQLTARLALADARVAEQADLARRLAASERAFSERERSQAQLALETARAQRAAEAAEAAALEVAVEQARARQRMAQAELEAVAVTVRQAELDLARTEIRAPIDGVVQVLHALPGRQQMLGGDSPHSTTVAELYDPARLQARIDVPLPDVAGLSVGQVVSVQCEALPDRRFAARVSRIVGEADIARNTLQVKVALEETDPLLRPGMLVRARFMGSGVVSGERGGSGLRLVLPTSVPGVEAGASPELWVVGEQQRLERRPVRLGQAVGDSGVEVLEGLLPGSLVVLDPSPDLEVGDRISIAEVVE